MRASTSSQTVRGKRPRFAAARWGCRAGACWAFCGWLWCAPPAATLAQQPEHIHLPFHWGATPLSAAIDAQAAYVAASGDFLESAAIARKINAEAVALEIENSVKYIDAYFKGRKLNREYVHEEEKPVHSENEDHRQKVMKESIARRFQEMSKGDPTNALNWLLTEISGPTTAARYLLDRETLKGYDLALSPEERRQIWLTEPGLRGEKLVFSLGEGKVLDTPWPRALLQPPFQDARDEYDSAKHGALQEAADKGLSADSYGRLMKAVNQLLVTLEEVYPDSARKDFSTFLEYNAAKSYLRSLIGQVNRLSKSGDTALLGGALHFRGEKLTDMLQFMFERGLVFAKPQPGGERIYLALLQQIRKIYLDFGTGDEEPRKKDKPKE
jgi:hypothetical protein